MEDFGFSDYVQHARSLDTEKLKAQFTQLESRAEQVREHLRETLPDRARRARGQLDDLTSKLFAGSDTLTSRQQDTRETQPAGSVDR
jgi:hypothetical protein